MMTLHSNTRRERERRKERKRERAVYYSFWIGCVGSIHFICFCLIRLNLLNENHSLTCSNLLTHSRSPSATLSIHRMRRKIVLNYDGFKYIFKFTYFTGVCTFYFGDFPHFFFFCLLIFNGPTLVSTCGICLRQTSLPILSGPILFFDEKMNGENEMKKKKKESLPNEDGIVAHRNQSMKRLQRHSLHI